MPDLSLSRRRLLALGAAGLLAPSRALARPVSAADRKFLFIYARGGWDTHMVFTPSSGSPHIEVEPDATTSTANGIRFVDSPQRPWARSFFENYGDRACVINGMEVRSVSHAGCLGILMTGDAAGGKDDWPAIIAGNAAFSPMLPQVVLSGPSFTKRYSSQVVRVGADGQLMTLLDGSALAVSDLPIAAPPASAQALEDAFVRQRVSAYTAAAEGRARSFGDGYGAMLDRLAVLQGSAGLDFSGGARGCSRDLAADAASAFDAFEVGAARVAMTQHDGWCATGWDTHSKNSDQTRHFEHLFEAMDVLLADLDGRVGVSGAPLAEEVTIVVVSEMGRTPKLNPSRGRDHWTFTSALLIGSGVRGGRVIGGLDEVAAGRPVDLASGDVADGGEALTAGHLGATLLALADVDPGEHVDGWEPIGGALAAP